MKSPCVYPWGGGGGEGGHQKGAHPFFSGLSLFFLYYFCGCHSPYAACLTVEFLLSLAACLPAKRGGGGACSRDTGVGLPSHMTGPRSKLHINSPSNWSPRPLPTPKIFLLPFNPY